MTRIHVYNKEKEQNCMYISLVLNYVKKKFIFAASRKFKTSKEQDGTFINRKIRKYYITQYKGKFDK